MSASRKLLTVFYADVAGYSRLTGVDEEGTHKRVMAILDHATDAIRSSGGTVLRYAGDAILASFPSAILAVKTSASIQSHFAEINLSEDGQEPIHIRIGINLGDVIEDRGEVYGEGVNIAARLESAAQPGGICISSLVHGQVIGKVDIDFIHGGDVNFKNIKEATEIFYWAPPGIPEWAPVQELAAKKARRKPAVAILPLQNLSSDPEQEHFADGLTEDIITSLSKKRWYDIAARNSTFAYKGQSIDIRSIGEALNVDFVLEGSVRKSGNRARITVQLINTKTGNHEWADKYDRELDDIFSVQDEITHRVSSILGELIWQSVVKGINEIDEADYGPFEWCFSAVGLIHLMEPKSNRLATEYLNTALAIDAELPMVQLGLGFCHIIDWVFMGDEYGGSLEKALYHADNAQRISPDDTNVYRLYSRIYTGMGKYEEAKHCVERALSIDPDESDLIINKGIYLLQTAAPADAIDCFEAVILSQDKTSHVVDIARMWKGLALFIMEDNEKAVSILREISGLRYLKNLILSACYAELGDEKGTHDATSQVLSAHPHIQVSKLGICKSFQDTNMGDRLMMAFQRAGLPAD